MARARKPKTIGDDVEAVVTEGTKRSKKPKQQFIDGMEPPNIPALTEAAEEYIEVRDQRMGLTKREVELHDSLMDLMKTHKLTTYEFDGKIVTLMNKEKVKVNSKGGDDLGEGFRSQEDDE